MGGLYFLGLTAAAAIAGADGAASGNAWQAMAKADLAAATRLIEENHPGAVEALNDRQFLRLFETARANAARRLSSVRTYYDYAAVMNGFANDFRDGHIWSRAVISPSRRRWAGIVVERRGGRWMVATHDRSGAEPDLAGAELRSCDGIDADALAARRTGSFHANPDVEASMASAAYTLLLDDQTPLSRAPRQCDFALDGTAHSVKLNWRDISVRELTERIGAGLQPAAAGMGVRTVGDARWIALESLDNRAAAVVSEVQMLQGQLRAAPLVVIDLRGNSGGNSQHASEIVRSLVGNDRADAATRTASACQGNYWRASAGNGLALEAFVRQLPEDRKAAWAPQAEALKAAVVRGERFSPALPACAATTEAVEPPPSSLPASAMVGKLVFVTDRACFSSCLLAADLLRRIGALHVGEATDRSTRYMEVREITLPSGLRTFSTLQKLALGAPAFGPYTPRHVFAGRMADTEALQQWVAMIAKSN